MPTPTSICIVDDSRHPHVIAPAKDVEAIVTAAGKGTRLGLGPKAFVVVAGRTLLEHTVTMMLAVAARVTVAVPPADLARAENVVAGPRVRVVAGGVRRIDTLRALVDAASLPWLLLQDVVHPFVTEELSRRVIDEAYRTGAAAAVLPNVDFLFGKDGKIRASPGDVVAVQKPLAFRRADIARGFEMADRAAFGGPVPDLSSVDVLALAGQNMAFVTGSTMNYKLTSADDFELAQRLMARD